MVFNIYDIFDKMENINTNYPLHLEILIDN